PSTAHPLLDELLGTFHSPTAGKVKVCCDEPRIQRDLHMEQPCRRGEQQPSAVQDSQGLAANSSMKLLAEVASSRSGWRKSSAMDGTCDAGSRVATLASNLR